MPLFAVGTATSSSVDWDSSCCCCSCWSRERPNRDGLDFTPDEVELLWGPVSEGASGTAHVEVLYRPGETFSLFSFDASRELYDTYMATFRSESYSRRMRSTLPAPSKPPPLRWEKSSSPSEPELAILGGTLARVSVRAQERLACEGSLKKFRLSLLERERLKSERYRVTGMEGSSTFTTST